ncbi:MAG: T9SS type A sorting domain-containing protein [Cyclobacteriaceae bacterium]|nr:T9SS type A sorting domain-containing protein [Cyclobacteriaceae bacterium]
MNRTVLVLLLLAVFSLQEIKAQSFPVETLIENGDKQSRINLVFLSDGYQANEMDKYISDVNALLDNMFNQVPFKHYKNYFNAYAIKVPSNESGASHPKTSNDSDCAPVPQATVDNYFKSAFDYGGIHRLLVPNQGTVATVLANNFPQFDQAFILVNSTYYGGSGGQFATSSTNASAHEVSIHEIGHSFAGLADEYWAGASYAAERPNLTQQSNPATVKWASWVGTNSVGVYPHAEAPTWFRPHQNCKMRFLNVPFCSVCNETFVERIHTLAQPLESYLPVTTTMELGDMPIEFSLSLIKPEPNTMSVTWKNNNVTFATNVESVAVQPSAFTANTTKITATITDNTTLSRSASHATNHVYVVEWTVTTDNPTDPVTSIEVKSEKYEYQVQVYPNPVAVANEFNFSYTLPRPAKVSVMLSDMLGRRVKSLVTQHQQAGEHVYQFNASNLFRSSGEYILTFTFDDLVISRKVVR